MAVFRVNKTRDYTVLSNYHFKDTRLSYKAKGLLSLMLSLPEDWDYSIDGLVSLSADGRDSIMSGLKELEKFGYLRREQRVNSGNRFDGYEYIIYETPQGEIPFTENPYTENPTTENPTQLNTNILNTNQPTTDRTNNNNTIVHFGNFGTSIDSLEEGTQNLQGGAVQTAGGAVQGTPISMITNSNSRKKSAAADIEEFFERVWTLYPKKTNKTQIRKATKERLYKIGYEKIARCIERYKQELEYNHTEYQFIKAGSTFFNGGYEDYLADDWRLPPKRATGQRHDYMPNRTPEEQAALEAKLAEYKFD